MSERVKKAVKTAVESGDDEEVWRILFEERVLECKVRKAYEGLVRLCHAGKSRKLKRKY